jgi:hypothetical protein
MVAAATRRRLVAGFESLEERPVMSGLTAVVADGALKVTGTARNESIRLSVVKDVLQINSPDSRTWPGTTACSIPWNTSVPC